MRGWIVSLGVVVACCSGPASAVDPDPAIRNVAGMDLRFVPAGSFMMGDDRGDADETPHRVVLTTGYYIGVHEVTNAQWKKVMERSPSRWQDDGRPVERVSWDEAVEFCRRLSELKEEREAGRIYRLPTEAEWEYACRAGTTGRYSFGDQEAKPGDYGWFTDNAGAQTHGVGQKKPNPWGLCDMHGNVWEWCSDRYGHYAPEHAIDPTGDSGAPAGTAVDPARVVRGGAYYLTAGQCRSAFRGRCHPARRNEYLGLRVALDPPDVKPAEGGEKPAKDAVP